MRTGCVAVLLCLAGCQAPSVPVYDDRADVPCPFEVVRTVRARITVPFPPSGEDQALASGAALGREGALAGTDAVIREALGRALQSSVMTLPADSIPETMTLDVFGQAIRYLPACPNNGS